MRDVFTSRLYSAALVVAALATLGAVIYLSIVGLEVNDYLAGLAGLTIGALLPSPMEARVHSGHARVAAPAAE